MIVYAGEDDSYITYITPSAYRELAEWMKYREESGEIITDNSWVMRDLWDTRVKISKGLVTIPKKLTAIGVKRLMERAIWAQGLRQKLEAGKKRHPFSNVSLFLLFNSYEILISNFSFAIFLTAFIASSDSGVDNNILIPIKEFSLCGMSINNCALPRLTLFSYSSSLI